MAEHFRVPALVIDGWEEGDIAYIAITAAGPTLTRLSIPSDWATVPYVLGISGGIPAWLPTGSGVILNGYGNSYGNTFGGP